MQTRKGKGKSHFCLFTLAETFGLSALDDGEEKVTFLNDPFVATLFCWFSWRMLELTRYIIGCNNAKATNGST
jgi:hypothetical protein